MRMNFAIIRNRWITLIAATFGMMLIGLYQYSWTLFSIPLQKELGTTTATIQLTFTIFTWVSTWTQPLVGTFIDRKGPLLLNILGGILTGIGWAASSLVKTPLSLYLAYSLGSIGVGIVYAISVGTATRWFPDRRGLATGLVIFGFGFGAAFLNPIVSWIVTTSGFRSAFLYMGVIMLLALLILSFFSRFPPLEWRPKQEPFNMASTIHEESDHEFTTKEMVKTH
jgi:OFA family oxalate/formate antiporter-like MFS transporter